MLLLYFFPRVPIPFLGPSTQAANPLRPGMRAWTEWMDRPLWSVLVRVLLPSATGSSSQGSLLVVPSLGLVFGDSTPLGRDFAPGKKTEHKGREKRGKRASHCASYSAPCPSPVPRPLGAIACSKVESQSSRRELQNPLAGQGRPGRPGLPGSLLEAHRPVKPAASSQPRTCVWSRQQHVSSSPSRSSFARLGPCVLPAREPGGWAWREWPFRGSIPGV